MNHWGYVTLGYAAVLGGFAALSLGALLRHRAAQRRLRLLDPRLAGGGA